MKKVISIAVLLGVYFVTTSYKIINKQSSGCKISLTAYIEDPDTKGKTNIRKSPKGEVLQQLPTNDSYGIKIIGAENGWLKIDQLYSYNDDNIKLNGKFGWIHSSIVKCSTRNYSNQVISVHESNRITAKVIAKITQETSVNILDICNDYVKISWKNDKGVKLSGWVLSEWLCGSPVTNCN